MEISQLFALIALAEEGSVTLAAKRLCLTQPAVTKQLGALENEVGIALFDRIPRGVRLTAAGAILLDYARRSLGLLEEARQALAESEAGTIGQLHLGAGVTTSIFQLPELLGALRETHPGIDVVVHTGESREVTELVLGREVELGLVTSVVDNPHLCSVPLFDEEIVLVRSKQTSPTRKPMTSAQLGAVALILFPPTAGFRVYIENALAAAGIVPNVKMVSDSVEAIKGFVAIGLGCSFLPLPAVATEIESGQLQRIGVRGLPVLRRSTSLIYRRDRHLGGGARAFLQLVEERYLSKGDNPP